jgi:hypothetical protein
LPKSNTEKTDFFANPIMVSEQHYPINHDIICHHNDINNDDIGMVSGEGLPCDTKVVNWSLYKYTPLQPVFPICSKSNIVWLGHGFNIWEWMVTSVIAPQ